MAVLKINMKKIAISLSFFILLIGVQSCQKSNDANLSSSSTGIGGSLARFTIVGNFLYLLDDATLSVYDISNPANTTVIKSLYIANDLETIFPNDSLLFIGSQTGMYIYSLSNPSNPVLMGKALHLRSCDPVISKDSFAFVTLKSGRRCGTATDGLYTYDIKDITNPIQIDSFALPTPAGLGYKDTTLFVCCENNGLAIVNIKDPKNPVLKQMITANIFYDVIPLNNLLVCMVKDGIDLYDIADVNNIRLIKNIAN